MILITKDDIEIFELSMVRVGRVVVGDIWATGSNWEGCWRDVGDRFRSELLLLERCGQYDRMGRVFVGEM
jgi:hypothetical protein